tara:strand:- start:233 stop:334 length:102 start_codon:yes stop_codon:yes gene_type:complete
MMTDDKDKKDDPCDDWSNNPIPKTDRSEDKQTP